MDNCTSSNRAMYITGRHDAFSEIVFVFLGALFLVALFIALLTICFPNKRTATAPPAYTEEAYEDTSIDVFIESDKE